MYSCDGKADFFKLEIIWICWFGDQETFLIINDVDNSCAA